MSRTWTIGDAIAEHDGDAWHLGVVVDVPAGMVCIRFDTAERATFRRASSPRLADPEQVPIDERSWVPAKVRDQLVRQEAADRLRAMAEAMPAHWSWADVPQLAEWLDNPLLGDRGLAAAARALLAPAPQPVEATP